MTLYTREGNQPRFRAKRFEGKTQSIKFVFKDITNWKRRTEQINGLEIFFKDHDHVVEKWETRLQNGRTVNLEFALSRKLPETKR